jgi:heptosyltransferase-2
MMRIAVFLPNWVGDVVMATPAIRALSEQIPNAELVAVQRPYVAEVLNGSPWFTDAIKLPRHSRLNEIKDQLQGRDFDVAILFPNSIRSAIYAVFSGAKRRIGYSRFGRDWFLTDCLRPPRDYLWRRTPHSTLIAYNRLVEVLGIKPSLQMMLPLTDAELKLAEEIFLNLGLSIDKPIWSFNPGAAYGAGKLWPISSFATLATRCADEFGVQVLILCGPGQEHIAASIAQLAQHRQVYSLANTPLSLGLIKGCIAKSSLLVTTDSGPRHFGTALGIPVITLYGPTHPEWTETFAPTEASIQIRLPCGPCQLRSCPLDHGCMRSISPQMVIDLIKSQRLKVA